MTEKEQYALARKIIRSRRMCNMPHPNEPGKRVLGWVVDAELFDGISLFDGIAAVDRISEEFKANA